MTDDELFVCAIADWERIRHEEWVSHREGIPDRSKSGVFGTVYELRDGNANVLAAYWFGPLAAVGDLEMVGRTRATRR
jgi:hypothetical protein